MTHPNSMSQQIGQIAIAFEEQRLGRKPTSITVVLGGDTLVITMHGILSPAERALAVTPEGATQLQEYHQQLFNLSSDPLRAKITQITGLDIRIVARDQVAVSVQIFASGTVVQLFLLAGQLPAESWHGV